MCYWHCAPQQTFLASSKSANKDMTAVEKQLPSRAALLCSCKKATPSYKPWRQDVF